MPDTAMCTPNFRGTFGGSFFFSFFFRVIFLSRAAPADEGLQRKADKKKKEKHQGCATKIYQPGGPAGKREKRGCSQARSGRSCTGSGGYGDR